jgi:WD40 repeat protein
LETSPFLRIKIRANSGASSTYSNLTVASAPSSGAVKDTARNGALAFSPDNTYLAVCPQKGTDSCIYKFNSSTQLYEKLASPFIGNLPSKFMNSSYWTNHVTWSADGNLLAIADSNNNSGSFEDGTTYIYERIGDTFTERASLPYGQRGNFDPSGQFYITGGSRNAQGGRIYKRGSTLTSWTAYGTVGLDNVGDWYEPTAQKFSPAII